MSELLEDAARDWIAERRAVGRTISVKTATAYRADLASWQRYLEAQTGAPVKVQDLTGPVIKAAMAEMNNAGLAPTTRRRLVTTLRGLCRYLVLESRLPADPHGRDSGSACSCAPAGGFH
ncbi:site-specific integrase [Brachybacterium sp. UNK5269]|uniref:site-specific integrase n=1 Tax=Brachybacterium sp. UNK5269 TaxID=3408576 RepID=UPI003BB02DA9